VQNPITIIPIDPDAHNFGAWIETTPPTCTVAGIDTGTCQRAGCSETGTRPIAALGHDFGDNWVPTTPATCTATGIDSDTCQRAGCSETNTRPSPALGHVYGNWINTTTGGFCVSDAHGVVHGAERVDEDRCVRFAQCGSANGTRSYCRGTEELRIDSTGSVIGASTPTAAHICIPDYRDGIAVTEIGGSAFYVSAIPQSVRISANVTNIRGSAFHGCVNLKTVTIVGAENGSSNLTSISNWAFALTGLTNITIPAGVTSIGNTAFQNCTSLATVTILRSATTTGPFNGTTLGGANVFATNSTGTPILIPGLTIKVPSGSVDAYKSAMNWSVYESIIEAIVP